MYQTRAKRIIMEIKENELILKPVPQLPSLEELIAECPEWDGNPPEKIDWGEPAGREII